MSGALCIRARLDEQNFAYPPTLFPTRFRPFTGIDGWPLGVAAGG